MRRFALICCFISALAFGCVKQSTQPQAPEPELSNESDRFFDSTRAGSIKLGMPFPENAVPSNPELYDSYWSNGYFVSPSLRMFYLDVLDLIVFMSPKHRVYRLALGPSYRSAKGIRVSSSLNELRAAYPDLKLRPQVIDPG